jgi:serine/threonine protein kinase
LRKFQHGNIITLHEALHGYRAFYLVLEHADMNIREYKLQYAPCQAGGTSGGWIKHVTIGVARALMHLHAAKVAHLNVKPENILLVGLQQTENGCVPLVQADHVRLSGFELCAYQQDLTAMHKDGTRLGTLGFFAPDVTLSRSSVDGAACDMWSLGATLMDMTTGFCEGWMSSYEHQAVDVAKFEKGLWKCLKSLQDKGLAWYKDADLRDLLVERLLVLPTMRITAQQVLQHKWMSTAKKEIVWV